VSKVYVRHQRLVAVQGGLVQVYVTQPALTLAYCKSLDSPEPELLLAGGLADPVDPAFVPRLARERLEARYRPRHPVAYPGLDITVSTRGRPRLGLALTGSHVAWLYGLEAGAWEGEVTYGQDTIFKLGLVHTAADSGLLYTVVQDPEGRYCSLMHSTEGELLWRLELWTVFDYNHSVFSVFTQTGFIVFGRETGSAGSYPFLWRWQAWTYQGKPAFYHTFETEFDMHLCDCSQGALVTPRAMTFLYPGRRVLVFTQRNHRGVAALAYTWGEGEVGRRLWRANCLGEVGAARGAVQGVGVVGSEVGGVAVTAQGGGLQFKDLMTGARLREEAATGEGLLWGDEERLLVVPRDLATGVTVLHHWPTE
jgi:hypothetical protein